MVSPREALCPIVHHAYDVPCVMDCVFLRMGVCLGVSGGCPAAGISEDNLQRKVRKAEKWAAARHAKERFRFLHLGFNVLLVIRQRAVNVRRAAAYYRHFVLKRLFQGIRTAVQEEKCVPPLCLPSVSLVSP